MGEVGCRNNSQAVEAGGSVIQEGACVEAGSGGVKAAWILLVWVTGVVEGSPVMTLHSPIKHCQRAVLYCKMTRQVLSYGVE